MKPWFASSMLVMAAGCFTPPIDVIEVGAIGNEAALEYAYGKSRPFRIVSPRVSVVAIMPRGAVSSEMAHFGAGVEDARAETAEAVARSGSIATERVSGVLESAAKTAQSHLGVKTETHIGERAGIASELPDGRLPSPCPFLAVVLDNCRVPTAKGRFHAPESPRFEADKTLEYTLIRVSSMQNKIVHFTIPSRIPKTANGVAFGNW